LIAEENKKELFEGLEKLKLAKVEKPAVVFETKFEDESRNTILKPDENLDIRITSG
jgi:hypothetical protein